MGLKQRLLVSLVLTLSCALACGEPEPGESIQGTPNVGGKAPEGKRGPMDDSRVHGTKGPAEKTTTQRLPSIGPAESAKVDGDTSLDPAKALARQVGEAIVAQDIDRARSLFLPTKLLEATFPGEACSKERASGEKERARMERKLPGILRRGARFLIHGPDNLDGAVEPQQEAKVKLRLHDTEIRRSKTIPKGKASKRGCTMQKTLIGAKVRLHLVASMEGKSVDVPINIEVLKVGEKGWYLAEL